MLRSSALSAAAGSTSSAGAAASWKALASVRSTASPADVSPSKVVTVFSPLCHSRASAEHQHHQLGQAQVSTGDQRHHEGQKRQHHRRVGKHLFAVRPDYLPHLGNDLLEVVVDECDRVNRPGLRFTGLFCPGSLRHGLGGRIVLGDPGSFRSRGRRLFDVDVCVGSCRTRPRPLAGGTLRPHHRLCHQGRPATAPAAVRILGAVGYGLVGNVAFVAHRMLLRLLATPRAVPLWWGTFQCPPWHIPMVRLLFRPCLHRRRTFAFSRGDRT
ncbi:exported hypothetical protein [Mycobacterium tuberculosis]|nr:exported hypothetical protein [Mycobacterium tuberculosis]